MSFYAGNKAMLEQIKTEYDKKFDLIGRILTSAPQLTTWGTVPCWWDDNTKTIILCGGEAGTTDEAPWKTHSDVNVIKVTYPVVLQEDAYGLFEDLEQLTDVQGAELIDTHKVTDMWRLFVGCTALKNIDASTWDVSKVGRFNDAFWKCPSLEELDLSGWETAEAFNFSRMFTGCKSLKRLDVSGFVTENVENQAGMFEGMEQLTELTLGEKSIFDITVDLPEVTTDGYTGRWVGQTSGVIYESSADFMGQYDGTNPDTFVREVSQ